MASNSKERKLYITPIYSLPASTRLSTSNLFSPTALEKPSFDIRPESSPALPTSSLYRKHHQKEMSGYVTTDEEFHALPPALKRKYFSTLERLRFAQSSRSNALNDLPVQSTRKSSIADRRGLKISELEPRRRSSKPSKKKEQSVSHGNDKSWYLSNYETFPDTIKRKQFSTEEQAVLSGRIREAVILDAADENLIIRRRSRRKASEPPILSPSFKSSVFSGKTSGSRRRASLSSMADTFFDSIHWIDEEPKLDLHLDDYHASIFPSLNSDRKPSFRRQMSISKLPFGRSSIHSPEPKSPSIISPTFSTHSRSKSRGLPTGGPKHAARHKVNSSLSSIDPNATHYQDPEARLKLRVYLASPQKFDEIIEFGFPSMDAAVGTPDRENRPSKLISRRSSRDMLRKKISSPAFEHTFFNDDTASLFEDDRSMADSDAPITPLEYESGFPSQRSPSYYYGKPLADYQPGNNKLSGKQQDSYTQCMAGNREPTLRMTLTRQDLRDESAIYGWQSKEPLIMEDVESQKCSRGPIGGTDSWGPTEKENGVVKRFWKKVKSQRKPS